MIMHLYRATGSCLPVQLASSYELHAAHRNRSALSPFLVQPNTSLTNAYSQSASQGLLHAEHLPQAYDAVHPPGLRKQDSEFAP